MRTKILSFFLAASAFSYCQTGTMPIATKGEGDISVKTVQEGETTVNTTPKVYSFVEEMPEFPEGEKVLQDFVNRNLVYPELEKTNKVQGTVMVRFLINEEGAVSDPTIIRGVSPGLDKEAVRIVKMLPNFTPGKQQGKPVKVYFHMPIRFKLPE